MEILFSSLLVVIVLAVIGVAIWEYVLNRKLLHIQLAAHKEVFAPQIWQARRSFRQNLRSQYPRIVALRIVALVFAGLTGVALLVTIYFQVTEVPFGLVGGLALVHVLQHLNEFRNAGLMAVAFFMLISSVTFAISEWQEQTLIMATNGDDANFMPWEPDGLAKRRRQLHGLRGLLGAAFAILCFAVAQTNVLPNARADWHNLEQMTKDSVQKSAAIKITTSDSATDTPTDEASGSTVVTSSSSSSSANATSADTESDNGVPSSKEVSSTGIFAATPANAQTVKSVSVAEKAAMYYMTYYSFIGKDSFSLFTTQDSNKYYYQVVQNKGDLIIAYYYVSSGTAYYTNYAFESDGEMTLYSLNGVTGVKKKLTDMSQMVINSGRVSPDGDSQSDPVSIAKIVGYYYNQPGYKQDGLQRVQEHLHVGTAMTAY